jgi:hypothetical protein
MEFLKTINKHKQLTINYIKLKISLTDFFKKKNYLDDKHPSSLKVFYF